MATPTEEMNPILAAAQTQIAEVTTRAEETAAKQEKITARTETVAGQVQQGVKDVTQSKLIIELQTQLEDLKAQNRSVDIIQASGTVPALADFQRDLVETSKELVTAQNEVEGVHEEYRDGFFNAIIRDFKLIGPNLRMKAAQIRVDNLQGVITNVSASTESVQQAVLNTKRDKNLDTIKAGQTLIQGQGAVQLGTTELQTLARNSTQLAQGMAADAQLLGFKLKAYDLHNTAVNQEARVRAQDFVETEHEFRVEQFKSKKELTQVQLDTAKLNLAEAVAVSPAKVPALKAQYRDMLEKFERKAKHEATYVSNVQKAQAILNLPVEESADIIIKGIEGRSQKERDVYNALDRMGTGEKPTFGATVGDAIINTSKTTIAGGTKPGRLLELVGQEYAALKESKREKMPKNIKELEAEKGVLNVVGKNLTDSWKANIKQGDGNNPYHAPPFAVLAEEYEAVKGSKLYSQVLKSLEMKEFDSKKIYSAALAGVEAGTVSMEEAALGIEAIFDSAVDYNNSVWMFDRAGLAVQDSYITSIVDAPLISAGGKGAGVGAGIVAAGLLAVPEPVVSKVAALTLIGAGGIAGTGLSGLFDRAFPLTDSTKKPQVMQALIKLRSEEAGIGSFFK